MKTRALSLLTILFPMLLSAQPSQPEILNFGDALQTVRGHLSRYPEKRVSPGDTYLLLYADGSAASATVRAGLAGEEEPGRDLLARVFPLEPSGYVVVAASPLLPRVIAYSFTAGCGRPESGNPLLTMLRADLKSRLDYAAESGQAAVVSELMPRRDRPEQWPATGDGWLKTNWTQNAPYNNLCPMDPVTFSRSYAGCPAVAMAQILNFHKNLNNTRFDDGDDYYHSYAGRNYQIDDDHAQNGFPSFPQLNVYLDTLQAHYERDVNLSNTDKAALVFACGVACTQVFTSEASGTFGVDQALEAYLRFGFSTVALLDENDADLYDRLRQNMMDTLPAHLAVVDPGWTTGHNVVVDGYNSDDYYHMNFGWGGMYNGWYLLPEEIPYNLTVVKGVVLDICRDTTTVSSHNLQAGQAKVFPNPTAGRLTIAFPASPGQINSVKIYNAAGCLIESRKNISSGTFNLDLSDRPGGLYLFTICDQQGRITTGKFVINR